jgi:hypothetical protein
MRKEDLHGVATAESSTISPLHPCEGIVHMRTSPFQTNCLRVETVKTRERYVIRSLDLTVATGRLPAGRAMMATKL